MPVAEKMVASWEECIKSSEESNGMNMLGCEDHARILKFFSDAGLKSPAEAVDVAWEDLAAVAKPSKAPLIGVINKVIKFTNEHALQGALTKKVETRWLQEEKAKASNGGFTPTQPTHLEFLGAESSAVFIARVLGASNTGYSAKTLLDEAHFKHIPYYLHADLSVFNLLHSRQVAAKAKNINPFLFVAPTADEWLISWMPSQAGVLGVR